MDLPTEDWERFARGVYPRGWSVEPSQLHAECLVEGIDPSVQVTVRLLQQVERQVFDANAEPIDRLVVAGVPYASREEAIEHEARIPSLPGRTALIETAGEKQATLMEKGRPAGTLLWRWEPLHATVEAWTEELDVALHRVRVEVANRLEWDGAADEPPPMRAFYATQVLLHTPDGAFASLAEPPSHLREHSAACQNDGLWPVPVGEAGDRRTMLASQVHQPDYPREVAGAARRSGQGLHRGGAHPRDVRHAA
jgi:hypothetical protein